MDVKRTNYSSGAPMEEIDGYSRIVQTGPFVYVGGTTSVQPDGSMVAEGDSYGQVKYVLEKLLGLIEKTGAVKEDVFAVKIYATPEFESSEGFRAYSELFREVRPLLTVVTIHKLTRPTQLVEIEMNAIVGCHQGREWEGILLERADFASGSPLEDKLGYSRMVKIGPFVYVGGTTSVLADGMVVGKGDAVGQSDFIFEKELALLDQVGAKPEDIIKVKKYVTEDYEKTWDEGRQEFRLPKEKIVFSDALVDKLTRPAQLVETEMFAILGCGGQDVLPEWGNIDFRKKFCGKTEKGFAQGVQAGPFTYASLRHSLDEKGQVIGQGDSEVQESAVIEALTQTMDQFGIIPEEVVKIKGYYTKEFGPLYGETETPYYEKTYKPVKPLYTGVYVKSVGGDDEIFTGEMFAVKGAV